MSEWHVEIRVTLEGDDGLPMCSQGMTQSYKNEMAQSLAAMELERLFTEVRERWQRFFAEALPASEEPK